MSLLTWILTCLFAGALIAVYLRRLPWDQDERLYSRAEIVQWLPKTYEAMPTSPDGTLMYSTNPCDLSAYICRIDEELALPIVYQFEGRRYVLAISFIDNDQILLIDGPCDPDDAAARFYIWHRRFPEAWWGHLYRPEMWLAAFFGGWLLQRLFAALRCKTKPAGSLPPGESSMTSIASV